MYYKKLGFLAALILLASSAQAQVWTCQKELSTEQTTALIQSLPEQVRSNVKVVQREFSVIPKKGAAPAVESLDAGTDVAGVVAPKPIKLGKLTFSEKYTILFGDTSGAINAQDFASPVEVSEALQNLRSDLAEASDVTLDQFALRQKHVKPIPASRLERDGLYTVFYEASQVEANTNQCGNQGQVPSPSATPTATASSSPTIAPTSIPTFNGEPTPLPSQTPTTAPTNSPTVGPTAEPTLAPTDSPTVEATGEPTLGPTLAPTTAPTTVPTTAPTEVMTPEPTPTCSGIFGVGCGGSPNPTPTVGVGEPTPTSTPCSGIFGCGPTSSPVPTSDPSATPTPCVGIFGCQPSAIPNLNDFLR